MEIKNRNQGGIGGLSPAPKRIAARPQRRETEEADPLLPPQTRGFRTIPNLDVLEKLVDRAVSALRQGIFWDRGSILNILV